MAILICNSYRIGSYSTPKVVMKRPLHLVLVLILWAYVEFLVRQWEATIIATRKSDPVPFFVDQVSPEEESFMKSIQQYIEMDKTTGETCLSSACLDKIATRIARTFSKPPLQLWCVSSPSGYHDSDNKKENKDSYFGLLMVKVPKAASSTAAGVTLRIQQEMMNRTERHCHVEYDHRLASSYAKVNTRESFLWTSIRDPTQRALSRVFFTQVSFKGQEPTNELILQALQNPHEKFGSVSLGQGGFQLRYTTLQPILANSAWRPENETLVLKPQRVVLSVKRIVESYGFVALVERMDESLVALSMLLRIPLTDVLISSSAKVAGSSYFMRYGKCVKLVKAFTSPEVKTYLESKAWLAQNYGDILLHKVINKSLEKTIDQVFSRSAFEEKLKEYKRLKALDMQLCLPTTILPCSKDGINQVGPSRQNCYKEDYGCGYPCINAMLRNQSLHTKQQRATWQPSSTWLW